MISYSIMEPSDFSNPIQQAIFLDDHSNLYLEAVTVRNCGAAVSAGGWTDIVIRGCLFYENEFGVFRPYAGELTIENSYITHNHGQALYVWSPDLRVNIVNS